MNALMHYLLGKYPGSSNLGCYNNRSVRGGHATSLHAVSRAFDWKYANRQQAEEVMEWLSGANGVGHVLGCQAIHDYHTRENNGSKWGKHSARARSWGHNQDWHWSHVGPGDTWLHIELNRDASVDPHLMSRIGHHEPVHSHPPIDTHDQHHEHAGHVEWPPFDPIHGKFGLWPLNKSKPTIRQGDQGDAVKYLQGVMRNKGGGDHAHISVDGGFGQQTKDHLMQFQRFFHKTADGICGPDSWGMIDLLAGQ